MEFSGAISSQTLATSGLAYCGSLTVVGAATVGSSLVVTGPVSASSFSGVGTSLSALNASNLSYGTVPIAQLGSGGTASVTTFLRGDNSWAQAVTAVTVVAGNGVSASVSNQGTTPALSFTLGDITPTSVVSSGAISGTTLAGAGSAITALNASNLASGTVPTARLGSGTANSTTFLKGNNTWASAVTGVSVVTANGVSGSVANSTTTPAITLSLGAITPSSVAATGNVGGATLSSSGLATLNSASITNNASVGGTLGVTGNVTAPSFTGALVGTSAYTPTLSTGVYAGRNSGNSNIPQFGLIAASAPANVKASTFYVDPTAGTLNWALLADDLTTNASFMTVARTGNTATNITLTGTAITLSGAVTANSFSGTGTALTALNASNLGSGTVPVARLGSSGTAGTTTFLRGDNSWSTAVTSVTIATANGVSATVANQGTTPALTLTLGAITPSSVSATGNIGAATMSTTGQAQFASLMVTGTTALSSASITTTLDVTGNITSAGTGSAFNVLSASSFSVTNNTTIGGTLGVTGVISGPGSGITALNASNLASGTVPVARLGLTGTAGTTTFLRGDNSWSTAVTAVTIATANGVSATVANQGTTPALTLTLGAITPSSVNTSGSVTASAFVGGSGSFTTISTSGLATLAGINATADSDFTTLTTSGLATFSSASVGGNLTVGGSTTVGGTVTAPVFIPTSTTVPTAGIYAASTGGVAIATSTLERFEITSTGQINISGPTVRATVALTTNSVDCSKGSYFTRTYSGSGTWTFTNVPTGGFYRFVLRLIRAASGTQTWPASVRWTGGSAPTLTNTNGGSDILEFLTDDGGTSWRAYRLTTTTS